MAERHWVGGSASWDGTAGSKWALTNGGTGGEAIPTSADDVFLDSGSGTVTVTVAAGNTGCLSLSMAGFTGTFAGSAALAVSGNLIVDNSMAAFTYTGTITLNSTTLLQNITTDGVALTCPITRSGAGGSCKLIDNFTTGVTRTFTLTDGDLDLNGKILSAGIFSSTGAATRSLTPNGGSITVTGSGTTVLTIASTTGWTLTTAVTVTATYSLGVGTRVFSTGAASEANAVSLSITGGTDALTISTAYKNLNFTGCSSTLASAARTIYGSLTASATMTWTAGPNVQTFAATSGTNTITTNGKTINNPITFNGVGGTWQLQDQLNQDATRALLTTNGTLDLNGYKITGGLFVVDDTAASGGGMRLAGRGGLASG
jgi:hypothetical protein